MTISLFSFCCTMLFLKKQIKSKWCVKKYIKTFTVELIMKAQLVIPVLERMKWGWRGLGFQLYLVAKVTQVVLACNHCLIYIPN